MESIGQAPPAAQFPRSCAGSPRTQPVAARLPTGRVARTTPSRDICSGCASRRPIQLVVIAHSVTLSHQIRRNRQRIGGLRCSQLLAASTRIRRPAHPLPDRTCLHPRRPPLAALGRHRPPVFHKPPDRRSPRLENPFHVSLPSSMWMVLKAPVSTARDARGRCS